MRLQVDEVYQDDDIEEESKEFEDILDEDHVDFEDEGLSKNIGRESTILQEAILNQII